MAPIWGEYVLTFTSKLYTAIFIYLLYLSEFQALTPDLVNPSDACSTVCDNGDCILAEWKCDGEFDCIDRSDEGLTRCGNHTCLEDHFSCGDGSHCIPESWKCDGHDDCSNQEDENNCDTSTCKESEFQCKNLKRCIMNRWVCDQEQDCEDSSDEQDCKPQECHEFQCKNGHCISKVWQCDGDRDCTDDSDEVDCQPEFHSIRPCGKDDFTCNRSGECIHRAWKCDGDPDCHDGSDEDPELCASLRCVGGQFRCSDNRTCIAASLKCDRVNDCSDGSDESDCPPVVTGCNQMQFDCSGKGDNCISLDKVCDHRNDCGQSEDELDSVCSGKHCNDTKNGGCSHLCIDTTLSYYCKCPPGMKLSSDNRTCEDMNECLILSTCSQICENKPNGNGFKCKCHPGYELDHKTFRCRASGDEPALLFANRHDLREIRLHTGEYQSIVDQLHSAIALDYDYRDQIIYWSDVATETISSRPINVNSTPKNLVDKDISTPDGLAFDWIHKNLYWTDTGNNRIEVLSVANSEKTFRKVLFNTNLDEPRAIVVDPRPNQWSLYWTDWGDTPKVERSDLDGSNRRTIIQEGIQWPNGLAIDYESNKLFWVDAKLHVICSSDLDGTNQSVILTSFHYLKHPFAITVFEDDIFWSDWEYESILKVSKFSKEKSEVKNVAAHLFSPMDVHIYHELKQPFAENICKSSGCNQLCLPKIGRNNFTCACSSYGDYLLADDGKTCYLNSSSSSNPNTTSSGQTKKTKISAINGTVILGVMEAGRMNRPILHHVAGIICGIIVAILLITLVAAISCHLYHRRAPKSLNFDNPVYRRTTEDQFVLQRNPKSVSAPLSSFELSESGKRSQSSQASKRPPIASGASNVVH